jgi:hypothetical protein
MSERDLFFVFGTDVPDLLVDAFGHALESVRDRTDGKGASEYEGIIYRYLGVGYGRESPPEERVSALVNTTVRAFETDPAGALGRINAGETSFRDPEDPSFFVFMYDANTTMVANAVHLVEVDLRGKTDVTGTPYHDTIVSGALKNRTGSTTCLSPPRRA